METKQKEYKYICEKCNIKCSEESRWIIHINSEKHKTGKKKIRCDYNGPYKCEKCKYETKNATTFKQHKLNVHSNKKEREERYKYYCNLCDIGTFSKSIYENHKKSEKHIRHETNYV